MSSLWPLVRFSLVLLAGMVLMTLPPPVDAGPQPFGRLDLDYGLHSEDASDLGDGHRLRRARIGLAGSIDRHWSYRSQVDFADNEVQFADAWLGYSGIDAGVVRAGQFKVPFSLDEQISSNASTFIERALPNVFAPARRTGIGFHTQDDEVGFSVMGFGQRLGDSDDRVAERANENYGIAARVRGTPFHRDTRLLHLGLAVAQEKPRHEEDQTVRFRPRPESSIAGVNLVDTGEISDVDRLERTGVEAAWRHGRFLAQGEYIGVDVDRSSGLDDYSVDGYYAQMSWMLTGQRKRYRNGVFENPRMRRGESAWEFAVRYSEVDLNDGALQGGTQRNKGFGLNYYPNANVRIMGNYLRMRSRFEGETDDPSVWLVRGQISF